MANSFHLDASALAKRYVPEPGSPQVDAILDSVPTGRIVLANVAVGEVVSIFVRKRNAGLLSPADFGEAMADFESEIVRSADISKLPVTNRLATSSFSLIVAHALNSTDAVILRPALAIAHKLRAGGGDLVVVAADQRLLRPARAEGLSTFNPERQDQAALAGFVGP